MIWLFHCRFYMFFNEILNVMSNELKSFTNDRVKMCNVIHMKPVNISMASLENATEVNSFNFLIQISLKFIYF